MSDSLGLINQVGSSNSVEPTSLKPPTAHAPATPSFKEVLMQNIEQVNKLQQDAEMAIEDMTTGRRNDIDAVLIAKQKADVAFQMLLQVHNKLVDAYEELKQMRI